MIDKSNTYLVLNYCTSPVAVATRDDSFIIPGCTDDSPGSYPFSIEEIIQINAASPIFKVGYLFFEEAYAKDIYETLRIRDWENILKEPDVEDIILHPTIEKLQKIIDIDNDFYFERVYGIYIGLRNANYAIPGNSKTVFETRHKELKNGKKKSAITLEKKEVVDNPEVAALKKELEELKKSLASLKTVSADTEAMRAEPVEPKPEPKKKAPAKKPAPKKRTTKK